MGTCECWFWCGKMIDMFGRRTENLVLIWNQRALVLIWEWGGLVLVWGPGVLILKWVVLVCFNCTA